MATAVDVRTQLQRAAALNEVLASRENSDEALSDEDWTAVWEAARDLADALQRHADPAADTSQRGNGGHDSWRRP